MTDRDKAINNATESVFERKRIESRLREAGVRTDCFVDLTEKRSDVDHTEPENQHPIDNIIGNYGVMPAGGLCFSDIDVEDLDELPTEVRSFIDSQETFTVRSPHGGLHLYFLTEGDVGNSKEWWGEIRSSNWYVVGPGSTIDHTKCADCDCSGENDYVIENDAPIETVDTGELKELSSSAGPENTHIDIEEVDSSFGENRANRIAFAQKNDEKFKQLWLWACGKGSLDDLDYDDRSRAEVALCQKLLFYFEWDVEEVKKILDMIEPPKWHYRSEGYRQSVIQAGLKYTEGVGEKFDPDTEKEGGVRVDYAKEIVVAIGQLNHERAIGVRTTSVLDRMKRNLSIRPDLKDSISRPHAMKVFNALEEDGFIERQGGGRSTEWVVHDLPDSEAAFWDDFPTSEEIRKQRRKYLRDHSMYELSKKF